MNANELTCSNPIKNHVEIIAADDGTARLEINGTEISFTYIDGRIDQKGKLSMFISIEVDSYGLQTQMDAVGST